MKHIVVDVVADERDRYADNIKSALQRKLPELLPAKAHAGKWYVCGGGPSLGKELDSIRKGKKRGAVIVSMNGTHDYLIERSIKPDVFLLADAKQFHSKFVKNPQKGIVYYIGSHCHPSVFDALKGYDVRLWHPMERECEYAAIQIGGGCTVGLRALNIGYALGFRNFHLFGFDGCVKETQHAYQEAGDDTQTKRVYFDGKSYDMTDWMIAQAQDFRDFMTMFGEKFIITVHSPGIIKHMATIYQESKCRTVN